MDALTDFHPADGIILGVLVISLLIGFGRGLVREVISLAGWVLAILVARWYNEPLAAWLAAWVETPSVRLVMAYGSLFLGTLLACSLIAHALSLMVRAGGLSLSDRLLGGVFGAVRGAVIVLVALMLMAPFVQNDRWFHDALLPKAFLSYESLLRQVQDQFIDAVTSAAPAGTVDGEDN